MNRLPVFLSFFLRVWNAGVLAAILGHEATLKMEALAKDKKHLVTVELPYLEVIREKEILLFKLP